MMNKSIFTRLLLAVGFMASIAPLSAMNLRNGTHIVVYGANAHEWDVEPVGSHWNYANTRKNGFLRGNIVRNPLLLKQAQKQAQLLVDKLKDGIELSAMETPCLEGFADASDAFINTIGGTGTDVSPGEGRELTPQALAQKIQQVATKIMRNWIVPYTGPLDAGTQTSPLMTVFKEAANQTSVIAEAPQHEVVELVQLVQELRNDVKTLLKQRSRQQIVNALIVVGAVAIVIVFVVWGDDIKAWVKEHLLGVAKNIPADKNATIIVKVDDTQQIVDGSGQNVKTETKQEIMDHVNHVVAQAVDAAKNYTDHVVATVADESKNYTDHVVVNVANESKNYTDRKTADGGVVKFFKKYTGIDAVVVVLKTMLGNDKDEQNGAGEK